MKALEENDLIKRDEWDRANRYRVKYHKCCYECKNMYDLSGNFYCILLSDYEYKDICPLGVCKNYEDVEED